MNVVSSNTPVEYAPPVGTDPIQLANWRAPVGPGTPWGSPDQKHLFVGVAISGGGSRSAVFSASVLEELERIGLLKETYAISSVSGGSLTAAYYVVQPPTGEATYWGNFRANVGQDLLTPWLWRYASPISIVSTSITTRDRSDLMADIMDRRVFHGAKFSALVRRFERGRSPLLLINSTLVSNTKEDVISPREMHIFSSLSNRYRLEAGDGFVFTEKAIGSLGSNLSEMRIADAVMASGAFPGVFNSRTLGAYENRLLGEKATSKPSSYIHLIDGGPSDNLGIDTIATAAQRWHQLSFRLGRDDMSKQDAESTYQGCLLVLIDAATGKLSDRSDDPDVRGPVLDYLVDSNALQAVEAIMKRRRTEALRFLGIDMRKTAPGATRRFVPDVEPTGLKDPWLHVLDEGFPPLRCSVWHIALDRVVDAPLLEPPFKRIPSDPAGMEELVTWLENGPWSSPEEFLLEAKTKYLGRDEVVYKSSIANAVSTVSTNYKLKSTVCKKEEDVEILLRAAARDIVLGDTETREQVCRWMELRGLSGAMQCRTASYERFELPTCATTVFKDRR